MHDYRRTQNPKMGLYKYSGPSQSLLFPRGTNYLLFLISTYLEPIVGIKPTSGRLQRVRFTTKLNWLVNRTKMKEGSKQTIDR